MTIKSRVLAAAAAMALIGGVSAVGALSAGTATAATPSCGSVCTNTYPLEYSGQQQNAPQDVLDVLRQGSKVGQPVILFRASNADPAEDWTITGQGTVADFYAAGLLSPAMAKTYGCVQGTGTSEFPSCSAAVNDTAWQLQYAPYGVDSGLCMGVASAAVSGEAVALEPCGASAKTVWIQDTAVNDHSPQSGSFWVAVNGSGTQFSNPVVLTYPADASPTDKPRAQLTVTSLGQFSNANFDNDNQLWTAFTGVLP
jgi:hypothetical protein